MSNFFILSFNEFFSEFIVQDIEEDMYDGQVLQKLIEKLTSETLNVPEVTQSEDGQRNKLRWSWKIHIRYSHLSNKRGAHAYRFWKIPPSSKQKKIHPPRLLIP